MTLLYRVLYCSRNVMSGAPDILAAGVQAILATSRANNTRDGITGGLLFSEGCFAQVLEGPGEAVEGAFERIQCDPRHGDVTVLQAGPIAARDFPNWSMGFTGAATASARLGGLSLTEAFSGYSQAGGDVLAALKAVVMRETEWLAPKLESATP